MSKQKQNSEVLGQLYEVIKSHRGGDPSMSYTANLFKKGRGNICKKFGEEAVEVIIANLYEKKINVISESADVLYHLLVLWVEAGIMPEEVWAELQNRVGVSGLDEKANRAKGEQES